MQHYARDRVTGRCAGVATNLDITEAMKRKMLLVNLFSAATQRVEIVLLRRTEVFGVQRPIGIEHFRVSERDGCSGGASDFQAHNADHVLPQVEDPAGAVPAWNLDRIGNG